MSKCYILNIGSHGNSTGLEVYKIGEEKNVLDRIVQLYGKDALDDYNGYVQKFMDGDHSIFKGGFREVDLFRPVYLGEIK